ncbi:hypothetical protein SASPL_110574 [Salvia splendens]|uniref:F-box domain-containing protein n=1 Tax=Salvia splendens TaxID=180675 RepID=A0A8X8Y953_SALSN|nr:hypothetical protein SASPL_110574 [Salvia splendens]
MAIVQRSRLEDEYPVDRISRLPNEILDIILKVETLDLVLIASLQKRYSFPYKEGNFPDNLKLLKKLSLHSVDISGEVVAYILGNCRLSLSKTDKLSSLQVDGVQMPRN